MTDKPEPVPGTFAEKYERRKSEVILEAEKRGAASRDAELESLRAENERLKAKLEQWNVKFGHTLDREYSRVSELQNKLAECQKALRSIE